MATRAIIPLARPFTGQAELDEVKAVLESGYLSQGPRVQQFETMVAAATGVAHAFATSSCTTGMHLALTALGLVAGDEVIVPDFTFPATANVVVQLGAVPILVDVDLATYNLDPTELDRHLSERTRAIMPVDLFGLSADMDPVLAFAEQHGLAVVEDAACALGASYRQHPCGSLADVACFSFHPRKIVTTGEGGMVMTNRPELAARVELLRSHGGVRHDGRFTFEAAGFNYRLSDLHAAIGIAQMRRLPDLVARRRQLAASYRDGLATVAGVTAPAEPQWGGHAYQAYVALLDEGIDRDRVVADLRSAGIEATIGTYALHAQPFFQRAFGYRPGQLPSSYAAFRRSIALPLFPAMADSDVEIVVAGLAASLAALT